MTAFRLVHVVGRHQHGQPTMGQGMDFIPKLAPRLWVHARRRFVQHQESGFVHDTRRQSQPLLPPTRERPRQLILARRQTEIGNRIAHDLPFRRHPIKPRNKA